jgi:hypothetical protein
MRRPTRFMALAVLGLALTAAQAKGETPSATLKLEGGSVAVGVLSYQGKDYPISVVGLSLDDVGIMSIAASGNVYNLRRLSDFDGNYTAAGTSLTAAGAANAAAMRNQNGVTVDLVSTTQGAEVGIEAGGATMTIDW